MNLLLLALAGLATTAPAPSPAAAGVVVSKHNAAKAPAKSARKTAKAKPGKAAKPKIEAAAVEVVPLSADATRVADWVNSARDNAGLPYIIVDKKAATLFLFDAKGKSLGTVPVLIGIALGDEATPGIGGKTLAEIGPAEKTTPAGRFLARFGVAAGRQSVLWVDYATSVALHPVVTTNPKEHRRERILSPSIEDNRITFGCINVPAAFYSKTVRPLFRRKGGYVYVLPDLKALEDVFPRLHAQPVASTAAF